MCIAAATDKQAKREQTFWLFLSFVEEHRLCAVDAELAAALAQPYSAQESTAGSSMPYGVSAAPSRCLILLLVCTDGRNKNNQGSFLRNYPQTRVSYSIFYPPASLPFPTLKEGTLVCAITLLTVSRQLTAIRIDTSPRKPPLRAPPVSTAAAGTAASRETSPHF